MNIEVTRYRFYADPHRPGTLRFTEHSPPKPLDTDHAVCGCTRNVTTMPDGWPREVTTEIRLSFPSGIYTVEAVVRGPRVVTCTVRWPRLPDPPRRFDNPDRSNDMEHAMFTLVGADRLRIEVTGAGRDHRTGQADPDVAFLATVFYGNTVDTSTLRNGWLPSRTVDPAALAPDDVWVHDCGFGTEAMSVLPADPERARLVQIRDSLRTIGNSLAPLLADTEVDCIRENAEASVGAQNALGWVSEFLFAFLRNLPTSTFAASVLDVRARAYGTDTPTLLPGTT